MFENNNNNYRKLDWFITGSNNTRIFSFAEMINGNCFRKQQGAKYFRISQSALSKIDDTTRNRLSTTKTMFGTRVTLLLDSKRGAFGYH